MPTHDDLAEATLTSWPGTIRVTASCAGVRSVFLPRWTNTAQYEPLPAFPASWEILHGTGGAREVLTHALEDLAMFFAGQRPATHVPLDAVGTPFQRRVWTAVAGVLYGETRSYAEIARSVGAPLAVRAVGAANGANPVAPFVPCHRVVGSDGRLTGYGPGLPLKQRLLEMEDAIPAVQNDYFAWVERVSHRLDTPNWVLGLRATGTYCRPTAQHHVRFRLVPNRIFATLEEAKAAGFAPCAVCFRNSFTPI